MEGKMANFKCKNCEGSYNEDELGGFLIEEGEQIKVCDDCLHEIIASRKPKKRARKKK